MKFFVTHRGEYHDVGMEGDHGAIRYLGLRVGKRVAQQIVEWLGMESHDIRDALWGNHGPSR